LEAYVAEGLCEFYRNYDPLKDRVWVCEHNDKIIGFLLLMHRCESAQLRYFLIHPDYRNIGLGAKLMKLYMEFLTLCNYKHTFLWTTNEQTKASSIYKKIGFKLTEEKESTNFGKPLIEQRYDFMIN
jgi:peptidyl-dipeptidase Dcp